MSTLQVDSIKHSGGTAALNLDSTGRVVQPNKPAFHIRCQSVNNVDFSANSPLSKRTLMICSARE